MRYEQSKNQEAYLREARRDVRNSQRKNYNSLRRTVLRTVVHSSTECETQKDAGGFCYAMGYIVRHTIDGKLSYAFTAVPDIGLIPVCLTDAEMFLSLASLVPRIVTNLTYIGIFGR